MPPTLRHAWTVQTVPREHSAEAIQTLVSIMNNPKFAPAARVSAANALLDRGYGKPPQHVTDDSAPRYVALLPEVCKTAEEWAAKCGACPEHDGVMGPI